MLYERISLYVCTILFCLSNIQSEINVKSTLQCSKSEVLCGKNICYDPKLENCTKTKAIQCLDQCGTSCYNPNIHQCFNGTICRRNEQLCYVKYDISGYQPTPYYKCYDSSNQTCLKNTICSYPSGSCNQQCLMYNQVCVNNNTICNVTGWSNQYEFDQIKLCDGQCYDSKIRQCINGSIQCIDRNCSGLCYNSSVQQCLNGTICNLNQQFCLVKYDSYGSKITPQYRCYHPSLQACFNNSYCIYPSRSCNQQCLLMNQVCAENTTICNVTGRYYEYQSDRIKLCNGQCYDSNVEECINGSIRCQNQCSGRCYNSSLKQCLNGTLCNLNENICDIGYSSTEYACYNPLNQTCLEKTICSYPSRTCGQQCLQSYQICLNNRTICNLRSSYEDYKSDEIKLCNNICYNSITQQCVDEYIVRCIEDPSRYKCQTTTSSANYPYSFIFSTFLFIFIFLMK